MPAPSRAIPAYARRHGVACGTCHAVHFPLLNATGRRFRDAGYRFPEGMEWPGEEPPVPIRTTPPLALPASIPLSLRGETFGVVTPLDHDVHPFDVAVYAIAAGGGAVGDVASLSFAWTPYPSPMLHRATFGLHDLGEGLLGTGTLNVRGGYLLLLDFTRPGHRNLAPGPSAFSGVFVGENRFNLDSASPGVQVYGRPAEGPIHYELAMVAGDPGESPTFERDRYKDGFARVSATVAENTAHGLTVGAFGYLGRSRIETELGAFQVEQVDDFWIAGPDLEVDLGAANLAGVVAFARHAHPAVEPGPVGLGAWRVELAGAFSPRWSGSVRCEGVRSPEQHELDGTEVGPHLAYAFAPNALALVAWRQDLEAVERSSAVLAFDAAF